MEWMLQVVDELDDAVGVLRHRWVGLAAYFRTVLTGLRPLQTAALRPRIPAPRT